MKLDAHARALIGSGADALPRQKSGCQRAFVGGQSRQQVRRGDFGVAGLVGLVLRRHYQGACPGRESGEALVSVERGGLRFGHKPFLRSLLRHAHALADVGPGRARSAGLVHEVADQVVRQLAEMVGGEDGVRQLLEHVGVDLLDRVDQVIEADWVVDLGVGCHASTLG